MRGPLAQHSDIVAFAPRSSPHGGPIERFIGHERLELVANSYARPQAWQALLITYRNNPVFAGAGWSGYPGGVPRET